MGDFALLERAVDLIARHPDCPGKPAVVQECLAEIEERRRQGGITHEERDRLVAVLSTPSGRQLVEVG